MLWRYWKGFKRRRINAAAARAPFETHWGANGPTVVRAAGESGMDEQIVLQAVRRSWQAKVMTGFPDARVRG